MTAEQIRAAGQAAVTPGQSLAIALAAVHAACPKAIRELTLAHRPPCRRIGPVSPGHLGSALARHLSRNACWRGSHPAGPLAADGDPSPPCARVFNIDHTSAMVYASAARNLLSSPAGQALSCRPE